MAIVTGGQRSIKAEGGVWFWAENGKVLFSVSDPELPGHSVIGNLDPDSDAHAEILALLKAKLRKVD